MVIPEVCRIKTSTDKNSNVFKYTYPLIHYLLIIHQMQFESNSSNIIIKLKSEYQFIRFLVSLGVKVTVTYYDKYPYNVYATYMCISNDLKIFSFMGSSKLTMRIIQLIGLYDLFTTYNFQAKETLFFLCWDYT